MADAASSEACSIVAKEKFSEEISKAEAQAEESDWSKFPASSLANYVRKTKVELGEALKDVLDLKKQTEQYVNAACIKSRVEEGTIPEEDLLPLSLADKTHIIKMLRCSEGVVKDLKSVLLLLEDGKDLHIVPIARNWLLSAIARLELLVNTSPPATLLEDNITSALQTSVRDQIDIIEFIVKKRKADKKE